MAAAAEPTAVLYVLHVLSKVPGGAALVDLEWKTPPSTGHKGTVLVPILTGAALCQVALVLCPLPGACASFVRRTNSLLVFCASCGLRRPSNTGRTQSHSFSNRTPVPRMSLHVSCGPPFHQVFDVGACS